MTEFVLKDEKATLEFGAKLAQIINESDNAALEFHLQGELGAGKTTLVRGILSALGWNGSVKSPTYTICEEYELNQFLVLHIDLYRTEVDEDIDMLELNREHKNKKLIFIEWPEKLHGKRLCNIRIKLLHQNNSRKVELIGDTILLEKLINLNL